MGIFKKKSHLYLLLASISLSLIVPLMIGGTKQFELAKKITFGSILLCLLLILTSWVFNAVRLRLLLKTLGRTIHFSDALLTCVSAEFAGTATPGAIGMPVAYSVLLKREGLALGRSFGLVTAMVLFDMFFYFSLMSVAAIVFVFQSPGLMSLRMLGIMVLIISAGLLFVWAMGRYHRQIFHFAGHMMGVLPWLARYRFRMGRKAVELIRIVRIYGRMSWSERIGLYLATAGYWLPRYSLLVVIVSVIAKTVPIVYLFLVQGVLNLVGQMIAMPGGAGGVEAGYAALMSYYMNPQQIAFTLLLWRSFTFYWYLAIGGPIFLYKSGETVYQMLAERKAHRT